MSSAEATRADVCGPSAGVPGGVDPELADATDAQVLAALAEARLTVSPARWRDLTTHAHALLTAHILRHTPGLGLADGFDPPVHAGPITAEADGPASRSFGATGGSDPGPKGDAWLESTPPGQRFLHLRRAQRGFGAFLASGGDFPA